MISDELMEFGLVLWCFVFGFGILLIWMDGFFVLYWVSEDNGVSK